LIAINVRIDPRMIPGRAVNKEIMSQAEADEEILTFDFADDVLERVAEQKAFTLFYCTHPWYDCSTPQ
jgi:hypothetical protein